MCPAAVLALACRVLQQPRRQPQQPHTQTPWGPSHQHSDPQARCPGSAQHSSSSSRRLQQVVVVCL
jgi:hypothetical protein